MSRLSVAVRRINWGKLATGASAVVSSGALVYAFPQYAPAIAVAGALLNIFVNPVKPEQPEQPVAESRSPLKNPAPNPLPPKPPMPNPPPAVEAPKG